MQSIQASNIKYTTTGQIANYESLSLTYSGSLSSNKWLSLVSSALESNDPCTSGLDAATNPPDLLHSSAMQAGSGQQEVVIDTTPLSTSISFAVCYAELSGTIQDTSWADSGVRLTVSKISSLIYGEETGRQERTSTSGLPRGEDCFPQVRFCMMPVCESRFCCSHNIFRLLVRSSDMLETFKTINTYLWWTRP